MKYHPCEQTVQAFDLFPGALAALLTARNEADPRRSCASKDLSKGSPDGCLGADPEAESPSQNASEAAN